MDSASCMGGAGVPAGPASGARESSFEDRATKLVEIIDSLAPPLKGDLDGFNRAHALLSQIAAPITAPLPADGRVGALVKTLQVHVIDFLKGSAARVPRHPDVPRPEVLLKAYPILLAMSLKLSIESPRVTVKEIEGKGKGVVATADLPANRVVTFYPIDILRVRDEKARTERDKVASAIFTRYEEHRDLETTVGADKIFSDFKFSVQNVDIYADPSKYEDGCCGHMMNDGDGPLKSTNNCVMTPLFGGLALVAITVVAVKEGTELQWPYGGRFWSSRV